jgi:hypothetical protein
LFHLDSSVSKDASSASQRLSSSLYMEAAPHQYAWLSADSEISALLWDVQRRFGEHY